MSSEAPTVIAPDDDHNHASGKENAAFYEISPCRSIRFVPGGYKIPVPQKLGAPAPNCIHLIHGNDEYYRMPWDAAGEVTLQDGVLINIKGGKKFAGFVSGETYILGVGNDNYPDSKLQFAVMWAGMIKVK